MFSSFLAKKKNETIPLQWLKTKKFYSGLGHLEENEPAKLLHLFTLNSPLHSALARPGVVSPNSKQGQCPHVSWRIYSMFHGESVTCFRGNLSHPCSTHWNKKERKRKASPLLPHRSEMQDHPTPQIKYLVLSGIIRILSQNPPAGRGIQQGAGSPQLLRIQQKWSSTHLTFELKDRKWFLFLRLFVCSLLTGWPFHRITLKCRSEQNISHQFILPLKFPSLSCQCSSWSLSGLFAFSIWNPAQSPGLLLWSFNSPQQELILLSSAVRKGRAGSLIPLVAEDRTQVSPLFRGEAGEWYYQKIPSWTSLKDRDVGDSRESVNRSTTAAVNTKQPLVLNQKYSPSLQEFGYLFSLFQHTFSFPEKLSVLLKWILRKRKLEGRNRNFPLILWKLPPK